MMARRFRKLAHSLYECKYHIVFCPKYRYKILDTVVSKYVHQEIYRLCTQKDGVEILELNVQIDHVHLVVRTPPSLSVSELMGRLKGRTAIRLFSKFPYLRKKKLWGNHFWQRGYFVDSVGANEEVIRRYVRYQDKESKSEYERQLQLEVTV